VDGPVLDVLRLGAYQLLRTRIPTHAAVSATVDLARRVTSAGPAAFANAVLRKVAAKDLDTWLAELAPAEELAALALRTSHPRWVASAFRDALRGDLDQTAAALAADDERPSVHLVARGMDRDELVAESGGEPGPWSPRAVRLAEGDPGAVAAVRDGRAGVQDEGSQLMALALAHAPLDGPDALWVDLCAGPGGKAALLDAIAFGRGARLVAVEVQPHRADLVRKSGVREVVTADAREQEVVAPGSADRVLLDAPCSGLGALRRRPEARWRRQPSDLPGLTKLQGELLDAAVRALRPGGLLAYVTCSPHLAETVVPVLDVLRRHPDLEQLDARPLLPGVPDLAAGPAVQLWPHLHGTDAMFLAVLRKRA
jgi:16S rRNA (cytosine967-C5)-methyltransferase